MKILITGATGLLGANVARELFYCGQEVILFARKESVLRGVKGLPCKIVLGDITNKEDVFKAVSGCDAVVHTAATISTTETSYKFYEPVNVIGTENIVAAIVRFGIRKLVHVSSASTFGSGSKYLPGNELSEFPFFNYNSGYVNSKFIAQQIVLEAVEKHNINAVVVNPTFMIGPYDSKPSSGQILLHDRHRNIRWCPVGGKNFVHVKDVAKGIRQALISGKQGHCYLLAGENLSYKQFFALLDDVRNEKKNRIVIPSVVMHAAAHVIDCWSILSGRKYSFNSANVRLLVRENYYTGEKAQAEFGIPPSTVKNAIAEALQWFKTEGYAQ